MHAGLRFSVSGSTLKSIAAICRGDDAECKGAADSGATSGCHAPLPWEGELSASPCLHVRLPCSLTGSEGDLPAAEVAAVLSGLL